MGSAARQAVFQWKYLQLRPGHGHCDQSWKSRNKIKQLAEDTSPWPSRPNLEFN